MVRGGKRTNVAFVRWVAGKWKENASRIPEIRLEEISTPVLEKVIEYMHFKRQYDMTEPPLPKFDVRNCRQRCRAAAPALD